MDKRDLVKLLPKDKFDIASIGKLNELNDSEFEFLMPDLFAWMADINWPIAFPIVELLSGKPHKIMSAIKGYLRRGEEDDELKYNIILFLIPKLPSDVQKDLLGEIKRIYDEPSDIEKVGSWEAASSFMDEYNF